MRAVRLYFLHTILYNFNCGYIPVQVGSAHQRNRRDKS